MCVLFLVLTICSVVLCSKECQTHTIKNDSPRVDDRGEVMDAHDGNVIYYQNTYYWYAASYGSCKEPSGDSGCSVASPGDCGFRFDHNVSLWTSTDLANWKYRGVVFQAATISPASIVYCPKVVYNSATSTFVLWVNLVRDGFRTSYYSVAVSANPFGPFKVVSPNVTTLAWPNVGDFNLLVVGSNAYVIYTAFITGGGPGGASHVMSIEQLTPDFLATKGTQFNSGPIGATFVEAPALIFDPQSKLYTAVFGSCCCYCGSGSPVYAYSSKNPLGPYTQQPNGPLDPSGVKAQQTHIFPFLGNGTTKFMWIGDRWQQSPNGKKSDDPTYWYQLDISASGSISPFGFVPSFDVTVC